MSQKRLYVLRSICAVRDGELESSRHEKHLSTGVASKLM